MFTVKLCKGHSIKLVGAIEVDVHACGPASGTAPEPKDRTNDVREISIRKHDGTTEAFYVAQKPQPEGWAEAIDFYDVAYIENMNGATTETVRPY